MTGPRVMCNGCSAVEVPLLKSFCDSCSAQVMEQLSAAFPATQKQTPSLVQIGPTDI